MSVFNNGGRNNKFNRIYLNEEQMYSSVFQDAAVNAAISSLKYLSPTDQVNMGLGVMGKPCIDTSDDASKMQLIKQTQDELASMQAKYSALLDSIETK